MELGMVGLGRMGANMVERLVRGGHRLVGYDRDAGAVAHVIAAGAEGADSLATLAGKLGKRRAIWIMVPSGAPVDDTIAALLPHLAKDDILIDGGNSNYKDTQRRGASLKSQGFQFVDVGTSGGIWGLKEGYSMMVGGDVAAVEYLRPLLENLAPAKDQGWGCVGPTGRGFRARPDRRSPSCAMRGSPCWSPPAVIPLDSSGSATASPRRSTASG